VGWLLIRNYTTTSGHRSPTHSAPDRRAVENYCRANAIKFEWQPTVRCAPGKRRAPSCITAHRSRCWFNQIAFLNEWTIDRRCAVLVDIYGEDGLPFNTRFGNGDASARTSYS